LEVVPQIQIGVQEHAAWYAGLEKATQCLGTQNP